MYYNLIYSFILDTINFFKFKIILYVGIFTKIDYILLFYFSTGMFRSSEWALTLFTLAVFVAARADIPPPAKLLGMNPCISKQSCHECIQTPKCAWCSAPVSKNSIF